MQLSFLVPFVMVVSVVKISPQKFPLDPESSIQSGVHALYKPKETRVFQHHTYEVVDTAGFVLYHGWKMVEKIPNKGSIAMNCYYFSKTMSGDIYELSIINLEKVFPENYRFHYAIEEYFRSDKDLMAYDSFVKAYKLKYLFFESLLNK